MAETKPNHVAIIMDGNGRWAEERVRPREWGHVKGAQQAMVILERLVELKVPHVTLWGFSTENWKRPQNEVAALMGLFEQFAVREVGKLDEANIKVTFLGCRSRLPGILQEVMHQVEQGTAENTGLHLHPAINYSGTQEMVDAINSVLDSDEVPSEKNVAAEILSSRPPFDLVIRTGDEERVSNFPVGHAELFFSEKLWPDFTTDDLDEALESFHSRERRLGGVKAVG